MKVQYVKENGKWHYVLLFNNKNIAVISRDYSRKRDATIGFARFWMNLFRTGTVIRGSSLKTESRKFYYVVLDKSKKEMCRSKLFSTLYSAEKTSKRFVIACKGETICLEQK
jgi:hypothetical protein